MKLNDIPAQYRELNQMNLEQVVPVLEHIVNAPDRHPLEQSTIQMLEYDFRCLVGSLQLMGMAAVMSSPG